MSSFFGFRRFIGRSLELTTHCQRIVQVAQLDPILNVQHNSANEGASPFLIGSVGCLPLCTYVVSDRRGHSVSALPYTPSSFLVCEPVEISQATRVHWSTFSNLCGVPEDLGSFRLQELQRACFCDAFIKDFGEWLPTLDVIRYLERFAQNLSRPVASMVVVGMICGHFWLFWCHFFRLVGIWREGVLPCLVTFASSSASAPLLAQSSASAFLLHPCLHVMSHRCLGRKRFDMFRLKVYAILMHLVDVFPYLSPLINKLVPGPCASHFSALHRWHFSAIRKAYTSPASHATAFHINLCHAALPTNDKHTVCQVLISGSLPNQNLGKEDMLHHLIHPLIEAPCDFLLLLPP